MRSFKKKTSSINGFTFFELLIAMSIIGVIAIPFIITFRNARANQALRSSAEQVADHVRVAHVFAREANEKKGWGIKNESDSTYAIIKGSKSDWEINSLYSINSQTSFADDFFIWFEIGLGETDTDHIIHLINSNDVHSKIIVNKNGVVEVLNE